MMEFQHLIGYPHLIRFLEEEQIPLLPYPSTHEGFTLRQMMALGMPDSSKRIIETHRKEIDRCLEFGYKYKILNKERRSRLKGDSPKDYWSSVSELKVGVWLEQQMFKILYVEPPSSNGGKGDYLVERMGSTVFIEVKTMFGEKDLLEQERIASNCLGCQDDGANV